jgi:polyisoprenoid-binding protein YceI
MRRAVVLLGCALSLSLAANARASDWSLDPKTSEARFAIGNMMVRTVHGTLGTVTGQLHLDEQDLTRSTVTASIDLSAIASGDAKRDAHLKDKDFFEIAKFPVATFTSNKVEKGAGGALRVTGQLVVHGVTKTVVLDVTLAPPTATEVSAHATTKLDRHDLGLSYGPGIMIGAEAELELVVKATPAAAPPAAR